MSKLEELNRRCYTYHYENLPEKIYAKIGLVQTQMLINSEEKFLVVCKDSESAREQIDSF